MPDLSGAGPLVGSVAPRRPLDRPPTVALAMQNDNLREALIPAEVLARLQRCATLITPGVLTEFDSPRSREVLAEVDALITGWGTPRICPKILDLAPRLQLVAHAAGSVRAVFDPESYDRGVTVTTAAQANAWPVAQWTLAMIILAGKRVYPRSHLSDEHGGRWPGGAQTIGNFGLTVGVIGASRIGRLVLAELARHDFRVLLADPTLGPAEATELGAELVPLEELMARSEVVTLHAPILESTKGMITGTLLATMKDGATFINSARGILVDHDGLRAETASGRIDAILDVTWPEPLPADDPLRSLPNVWLTPHLAGAEGRELVSLGTAAVAEVEALASGSPYHFAVGPDLYRQMA